MHCIVCRGLCLFFDASALDLRIEKKLERQTI